MMGLSAEEFPASIEEADYYLVLTPDYQYGGYYQASDGSNRLGSSFLVSQPVK